MQNTKSTGECDWGRVIAESTGPGLRWNYGPGGIGDRRRIGVDGTKKEILLGPKAAHPVRPMITIWHGIIIYNLKGSKSENLLNLWLEREGVLPGHSGFMFQPLSGHLAQSCRSPRGFISPVGYAVFALSEDDLNLVKRNIAQSG